MHAFPTTLPGTQAEVKMWAHEHEIDSAALQQLRNIASLPWVVGVRVMPDVHLGKGATVGSVIAMSQAVAPAAVGVDIGCGMAAVRTSLRLEDLPDDLHPLRLEIEAAVPVGFAGHQHPVDPTSLGMPRNEFRAEGWGRFWDAFDDLDPRIQDQAKKAHQQMGSLGGGNHFIEVCSDDDGAIWVMLHSGSRGIGNLLAQAHMTTARGLPHNDGIPDRDLAVFLAGTPEMAAYRRDLEWAQDYALRNRAVMMALVQRVVGAHFAARGVPVEWGQTIQCHHNYVAQETYDGIDVLVTRKGAIRAGAGDLGLIPGSMGTGSFVVRGLGNVDSYCSASHGAGRRMSRNAAKKRFTEADLAAQTAGVECRKDAGVVDEIPGAYKDLDSVIAAQSDLVEVVTRLTTLLCVKG
ncbi:MAG TPA: RtcB family protein [Dermatophilaceae bacterium]|jgi:tRNA-splicing ligase RtcB|nr:RtcB family protein [Dermatophilaceae bacterium]